MVQIIDGWIARAIAPVRGRPVFSGSETEIGQIAIAQLNINLDKEHLNKGISFGLDELTRPYDNYEIVRIMVRILFHISKRERNKNYICSELVRDILAKSGVIMHYQDTYISPDNIWKDQRVELKYRIL